MPMPTGQQETLERLPIVVDSRNRFMGETGAVETDYRQNETSLGSYESPPLDLESPAEADAETTIANTIKDQTHGFEDPDLNPQPTKSLEEFRPTPRVVVSPNNDDDDDSTWHSTSNENLKEEAKDTSKQPVVDAPHLRDIIGHEEVKQRIAELTLPLFLPDSILQSVFKGIRRLPTTILLHGPPGCGKVRTRPNVYNFKLTLLPPQTKLARAIAGEAEAALIQVAPSDVLSKFVGESEGFIRKLFCTAVEKGAVLDSRCAVIFFDEIDALGRDRESSGDGEGEACSRRVLTELLLQLNIVLSQRLCSLRDFQGHDESIDNSNNMFVDRKVRIVIAAATNRPGDCDSALLRRFELTLEVGLPSPSDRLLMFAKHLDDIDNDLTQGEFNLLAALTSDWSGASIETLCRDAVQAPVRDCIQQAILVRQRAEHCNSSKKGSEEEEHSPKDLVLQTLLSGITSLRPVSILDFQNSIENLTGQHMPDGLPPSPKRICTEDLSTDDY